MKRFYSNGKLLISGEYVVLDGATALAVPTKQGQSLTVENLEEQILHWKSYLLDSTLWIDEVFALNKGKITPTQKTTDLAGKDIQQRLGQILTTARELNPEPFEQSGGYKITTHLGFPNDWGLGSSSTLINNIAEWFEIDPFELLARTFGGSGYDIASARNDKPITFSRKDNEKQILSAAFDPPFKDELFFVHLNRKQSSRESIKHYRAQPKATLRDNIEKISGLTHQLIGAQTILEFELLLEIHENIISCLINRPKVKSDFFPDYTRGIKSLGGWGGDFILATGKEDDMDYFRSKGYHTIIPYQEMVL